MKISESYSVNQAATANAANAEKNASAPVAAGTNASQRAHSSGVAVTVSSLARGLEKSGRASTAEVDAQKVATVKASMQDGTYVVNPEAIADKLLSNAKEMLDRTTS